MKRHEGVFTDYLASANDDAFMAREAATPALADDTRGLDPEATVAEVTSAPTPAGVEENTRDFIVRALLEDLSHGQFEHFTADLLRAMGYVASVTSTPPTETWTCSRTVTHSDSNLH